MSEACRQQGRGRKTMIVAIVVSSSLTEAHVKSRCSKNGKFLALKRPEGWATICGGYNESLRRER
jgi:hypothetical protein